MRDPAYLLIAAVWVLACAWGMAAGRGPSRIAALLLILQLVLEFVAYLINPAVLTRPITHASDAVLLVFFLVAAYRDRPVWATAAAGGQLVSIMLQIARATMPHVSRWASVTALDLAGFVVLAAVLAGAWTSRLGRA